MSSSRLLSFTILLSFFCCYLGQVHAAEQQKTLMIGTKTFTLDQLKKQFKTIRITVPHNPAFNNEKKVYDAFDMNDILTQLLHIDLQAENSDKILVAQTLDKYVSQTPIPYFTSKGHAYLAYQETPGTILANNITKDGHWSYSLEHGKKEDPGPFYMIWDNIDTYPSGWPYQIISIQILSPQELTFFTFLNPVDESQSIKKGHLIFSTVCYTCHSLYYKGAQGRAPDLGMVASYLKPKDISNMMRKGREYMPPIGKNFSEEEIEAVIAYLTWVSKQSPKVNCQLNK